MLRHCGVWVALWACALLHSAAQQPVNRKLRTSEAIDCSSMPGTSPGHYIVGEKAYQYFEERNQTHLATKAWFKDSPLKIKKGCTFNYRLHYGDEVHLVVDKDEKLSEMWYQYDQEKQPGATAYQSMIWFVAWEEYMSHYNSRYGGIPSAYEQGYIVYLDSGETEFPSDQRIENIGEQRHDLYHMRNATSRWYQGQVWQEEEHVGELRVCLYANHWLQMRNSIYSSDELIFMGTNTWHEHPPTGKIRQDQYDALKSFYKETCAPYRGPDPQPAWDKPWDSDWARYNHLRDVSSDYDNVPYCTWLPDGWNDTYWSQHLDVDGGACHMISGVYCDKDGYIDELRLSHMGLQGDLGKLLNSLTGLRILTIRFNALSGTIPKFLETQKELNEFDIWHNFIAGTAPCFSSDQLWKQDLSYNRLTGSLPRCPNGEDVHDMYLEHNDLSGDLPKEWKDYVNFRNLWVSYNRIGGSIPKEICTLNKLWRFNIEGNVITGSIPEECLANKNPTEGLFNIYAFLASHNRLTGTLPRINSNKAKELSAGGIVQLAYNFLSGTYFDQWDDYLYQDAGSWWGTTFDFKDNLLSGPLPAIFRILAMEHSGGGSKPYFHWYFQSNYFRCEPDGRWPDWVNRRVDSWVGQGIGKCLPVARPSSVPTDPLIEGQVTMLAVQGSDFIARGSHRCRFNPTSPGQSEVTTTAIRETDNLIRCLVPGDLAKGTYEVQVSNFGDDWSSSRLIQGYGNHPTISVIESPIPSSSTHLNVTMVMSTDSPSSIDKAVVQNVLTDMFGPGVEMSNFEATSSSASLRRLQSGQALIVRFHLAAPSEAGQMQSMKVKLEDVQAVQQAFKTRGVTVEVTEVSVRGLTVTSAVNSNSESKKTDVVLIIVACLTFVVACGLCGFIVFLYRMERSGKAYFKESLEETGDIGQNSSSIAPAEKIGAAEEEVDGCDV